MGHVERHLFRSASKSSTVCHISESHMFWLMVPTAVVLWSKTKPPSLFHITTTTLPILVPANHLLTSTALHTSNVSLSWESIKGMWKQDSVQFQGQGWSSAAHAWTHLAPVCSTVWVTVSVHVCICVWMDISYVCTSVCINVCVYPLYELSYGIMGSYYMCIFACVVFICMYVCLNAWTAYDKVQEAFCMVP